MVNKMENTLELKKNIEKILREVAKQIRNNLNQKLDIDIKSNKNDLVTNKDKEIEQYINREIKKLYPDSNIISEEGFGDKTKTLDGLVFFVDPIDGTLNFVKSHDNFASMIGVYYDGEPILGAIINVIENVLYIGGPYIGVYRNNNKLSMVEDKSLSQSLITISSRLLFTEKSQAILKKSSGLRIFGSAGIIFGRLLEGRQGAYISKLAPWDLAAGKILSEMLGLIVVGIDGKPINMLKSQLVVIGTKQLTQEVLKLSN